MPWGGSNRGAGSRTSAPNPPAFFEAELRRELGPGNPLFGRPVAAVGKRDGSDDVLFRLLDGTGRVAVVHLTSGKRPESPPWPGCTIFSGLEAWAAEVMRPDHEDFRAG